MQFPITLRNQRFICDVESYIPDLPMRITGSGYGDADPPEAGEILFTLTDESGQQCDDLVASLDPYEMAQVINDFQIMVDADYSDPY